MIKKHIRKDNPDYLYKICPMCDKRVTALYLSNHIESYCKVNRQKQGENPQKVKEKICEECGVAYKSNKDEKHNCSGNRRIQEPAKKFCPECGLVYKKRGKSKAHSCSCKKIESALGQNCTKGRSIKHLNEFECDDCDFVATKENLYRQHVVSHATWFCVICNQKMKFLGFFKQRDIEEHMQKEHGRPLTSDVCQGPCVDRDYPPLLAKIGLQKQAPFKFIPVQNHTPIYQEDGSLYTKLNPNMCAIRGDIRCNICKKDMKTVMQFKYHLENLHGEYLPYHCATCTKVCFLNEGQFGKHLYNFHYEPYEMKTEPRGLVDDVLQFGEIFGRLTVDPKVLELQSQAKKKMYQKIKNKHQNKRASQDYDDDW